MNDWKETLRKEHVYNQNGFVIEYIDWNFQYASGSKQNYLLDKNGNVLQIDMYVGGYDNWTISGKGFYFWTEIPTVLPSTLNERIEFFPNPAKDYVFISGLKHRSSVLLFDLSGHLVLQETIEPGQSLSVRELPAGVYVVRLDSENAVSGRLVKE